MPGALHLQYPVNAYRLEKRYRMLRSRAIEKVCMPGALHLLVNAYRLEKRYRICFVPGQLKYNTVRLHARRLASAVPCERIPTDVPTLTGQFNPADGYSFGKPFILNIKDTSKLNQNLIMEEDEMGMDRIYNFNAGPAALPLPVLEEIQDSFLNFSGSGMSITEVSHRSKWFDDVINDAIERIKRVLNLDDKFQVLFLQGGASMQFCMVPMNFLGEGESADYVNTGTWSTKAIKEAEIQGKTIQVVASSEDKNFSYIPKTAPFNRDAVYTHITSNNTIKGTQWASFPDTGGVPIVSDMSSDIFSRPLDMEKFGLIYAGAQKNMGPAGVCLAIIREDLLARTPDDIPTMLRYTTYAQKNSMFNTPPCFAIYTVQLVLKWLEETIGGLDKMTALNREKADKLYDYMDQSGFYKGTAEKESRSLMNVTFRLPSEDLEQKFVAEALENGLGGLKGHRSVGGCRASIYNPTPMEAVSALVDFMKTFEKKNG
jgi:phosphoserine aminotransferase